MSKYGFAVLLYGALGAAALSNMACGSAPPKEDFHIVPLKPAASDTALAAPEGSIDALCMDGATVSALRIPRGPGQREDAIMVVERRRGKLYRGTVIGCPNSEDAMKKLDRYETEHGGFSGYDIVAGHLRFLCK